MINKIKIYLFLAMIAISAIVLYFISPSRYSQATLPMPIKFVDEGDPFYRYRTPTRTPTPNLNTPTPTPQLTFTPSLKPSKTPQIKSKPLIPYWTDKNLPSSIINY
jgi:hypothetical protein